MQLRRWQSTIRWRTETKWRIVKNRKHVGKVTFLKPILPHRRLSFQKMIVKFNFTRIPAAIDATLFRRSPTCIHSNWGNRRFSKQPDIFKNFYETVANEMVDVEAPRTILFGKRRRKKLYLTLNVSKNYLHLYFYWCIFWTRQIIRTRYFGSLSKYQLIELETSQNAQSSIWSLKFMFTLCWLSSIVFSPFNVVCEQ